jgi:hypothetical protein
VSFGDEAEVEEEEDDLKTEIDEEVAVSDSDGNDDSPSEPEPTTDAAVYRGDEHSLHDNDDGDELEAVNGKQRYSALMKEEEERDTSDKESEAMLEDGDLAEMAHDVYALEQEIARLMELKREREQKMEAIHRRRARERKLKVKREAKEREKARLRARQLSKVADGRTDVSPPPKTAAAEGKERVANHEHQRARINDEPPLFTPSHDHPVVAAPERGDDEDDDGGALSGKAKECEPDDCSGGEEEEGEEEVETDERKLVEVINNFLRRDKKDKDSNSGSSAGSKDHHAGANSKRRTEKDKEKEKEKEEGKKAETLSPSAKRKIFHSSFSTISSHLPSFAFHSSDKVDKAADKQAAVPEQGSSTAAAKASTGDADQRHHHQQQQRSEVNADGAHPATGSGENDDDRERERDKKGHSNIVTTYINRRISGTSSRAQLALGSICVRCAQTFPCFPRDQI